MVRRRTCPHVELSPNPKRLRSVKNSSLSAKWHNSQSSGRSFTFIAVFLYVELQFAGDPLPPAQLYYAPSALAFLVALAASLTYARSKFRFGRLT